jgi:hypothetical protein
VRGTSTRMGRLLGHSRSRKGGGESCDAG